MTVPAGICDGLPLLLPQSAIPKSLSWLDLTLRRGVESWPPCKYTFINESGDILGSASFEKVDGFREGMAAVWIDGLWGYVDDSLSLTIPPQFRMAAHFSEGLAAVLDARGYSYIDRNSRLIIPGPFDSAGEFHEGVAVVYRDQKAYYIDKKGVPAVPDTYAHAGRFFHGVANVILNDGSSAYIDRAGKVVYKAKLH